MYSFQSNKWTLYLKDYQDRIIYIQKIKIKVLKIKAMIIIIIIILIKSLIWLIMISKWAYYYY